MAGTADDDKACETTDRTGDRHRAHDDLLYVDADVLRRILTLADNRDLVALFAVL